jgi:hypothetical protein
MARQTILLFCVLTPCRLGGVYKFLSEVLIYLRDNTAKNPEKHCHPRRCENLIPYIMPDSLLVFTSIERGTEICDPEPGYKLEFKGVSVRTRQLPLVDPSRIKSIKRHPV